ncbi:FAD-dependent monooxygenase [Streptomyces sp. MCL20-2]|uniref:FAD-dependent monooxygenase n=1 Tax=Streptomyces sp. MCL20-2 TaxID=2967219 RepID=UPI002965FA5E|nr:FAD-dependent monooxygenase [Streptomyces sp. MCL20-2]
MAEVPPRVAIVGAGIAGVALAAALSQRGLACNVFEKTRNLREIGAGIQISPNGSRLLQDLGIGRCLERRGVRPDSIDVRNWADGRTLARTPLGQACEQMYGAPYLALHRADLHSALVEQLPESVLHLGLECVEITQVEDEVAIRCADGFETRADVVIGADGIRSAVRQLMIGDEPRFSGQSIYRAVVPAEAWPTANERPHVSIWMGPGQHCVAYPISGGASVSVAATAEAGDWRRESWSAEGSKGELLDAYAGWAPELLSLLSAAPSVTRWALYDRDPVDRWSNERVTLIGDAAHPMLPFGAQGASLGLEDALTLAICLQNATASTVPDALRRYEALRRPRTEQVHRFIRENERNHHVDDGDGQRERDAVLDTDFGLRQRAWLFGHDAAAEATSNVVTPVR